MNISAANLSSALYGMSRMSMLRNPTGITGQAGLYDSLSRSFSYYNKNNIGTQGIYDGFRDVTRKLQETDWDKSYRFSGKKRLQSTVNAFAEAFNGMLAKTSQAGGSLYASRLKEQAFKSERLLSEIGLQVEKDGTLSVNGKTLKRASASDFKAVFEGADSFAGRTAVKSIYAQAQQLARNPGYGAGSYGTAGLYGGYGAAGSLYGMAYPYAGRYFDMFL